jgi:Rrf2 family protein
MAHPVRISEAASLALHTMALLASQPEHRYTTEEIATTLCASAHHLAKIMQRLARANLVTATRGPQGGFFLKNRAEDTTLLEVYEAIEGPMLQEGCLLAKPPCGGAETCILGDLVQKIHQLIRDHFAGTTLATLAAGAAVLQPAAPCPSCPAHKTRVKAVARRAVKSKRR